MQTKILSLCEARIFSSLEGSRGCRVTQVTKCRFSRLGRGVGRRWPWKPWLLRAGVRSGRAAACLIDGLVLWDATGAEMLWPSEEVLTASHRAVVLPWSFSAEEHSWPGSCGPCETLLLSVVFGRFLLLDSSPAEESVKPSKSFPSDTPINSVKE